MPLMTGPFGLSVAAPLLCPAEEVNPDQPTTAAAAAAAVAAAGVRQGESIGLGSPAAAVGAHPSHLQTLQMETAAPGAAAAAAGAAGGGGEAGADNGGAAAATTSAPQG
jgi:hypothetical protein